MTEYRYLCMPRARLTLGSLAIAAVQPAQIEAIRLWRNAQLRVLRQTAPISAQQQQDYFARHIWPEMAAPQPTTILVAFFSDDVFIGYGGLVHIAWEQRRAEVSFLLDTALAGTPDDHGRLFPHFLCLMQRLAFHDLGLERLCTETYDLRPGYLWALELAGFQREGTLRGHVIIDGTPTNAVLHGLLSPARGRCTAQASAQDEQRASAQASAQTSAQAPAQANQQASLQAVLQATEIRVAAACKAMLTIERAGLGNSAILVTSSGRKLALLEAMQQAARRVHPGLRLIAGDAAANVPARYLAPDFWMMPPTDNSCCSELLNGCRERGIKMILPTRDAELPFWARHRADFAAVGVQVLVSAPEAVAVCHDKLRFAEFGRKHGFLCIPTTTDLAELVSSQHASRTFVVKERFGAGSKNIGLNLSEKAARQHALTLANPVFQPFLEGREISIDAWLDRHSRLHGMILRSRDLITHGEAQITTTFQNQELATLAAKIVTSMQLRGPVVLQLILDAQGHPHILECNPRFGGASTAAIAAGLDLCYLSVLESFGIDIEPFLHDILTGTTNATGVTSTTDATDAADTPSTTNPPGGIRQIRGIRDYILPSGSKPR